LRPGTRIIKGWAGFSFINDGEAESVDIPTKPLTELMNYVAYLPRNEATYE
jgi:hypothetical protein